MLDKRNITYMFDFLNSNSRLAGVYGLWLNSKLLYIGQSNQVLRRVTSHWFGSAHAGGGGSNYRDKTIEKYNNVSNILKMGFDNVTLWECSDKFESMAYEKFYTHELRPSLQAPYTIPIRHKTKYDKLLYIMTKMIKQGEKRGHPWKDVDIGRYLFKKRI